MRVGEGRPFGKERTDGLGLEAEGGREVTVAQRVTGGIVTTEEDIDTGVIARGIWAVTRTEAAAMARRKTSSALTARCRRTIPVK